MAETPLVWMTSGSRGGPGKLRATCRRVLMALAMTVFVGGCEMINSSEQLLIKELAERHVNDHAADPSVKRRPVIVIPGILGSRLKTADTGQVVWGQFGFQLPASGICITPRNRMEESCPTGSIHVTVRVA